MIRPDPGDEHVTRRSEVQEEISLGHAIGSILEEWPECGIGRVQAVSDPAKSCHLTGSRGSFMLET